MIFSRSSASALLTWHSQRVYARSASAGSDSASRARRLLCERGWLLGRLLAVAMGSGVMRRLAIWSDSRRAARTASTLTWSRSTSSSSRLTPEAVQRLLLQEWPEADALRNLTCHEISDKHAVVSQVVPSSALRPGGYISGPFQFTLADLGMWVTAWGACGFEPMALTSELSIRYLRPAIGSVLWARVDLNAKAGRSLVSTATMWASDGSNAGFSGERAAAFKPCSVAQGTYVLPRKPPIRD